MKKSLLVLGLVAVTLMASANEVFAQGIWIGRGGVSVGIGSGYYGSGYYGSGYYGSPYYYGAPGYYGGRGYYSTSPYYYGSRYYAPSYYSYSPGYYYGTTPSYTYSNPIIPTAPIDIRQSAYSDPNSATITVFVPTADAQVWFDDNPTAQRGIERLFHTPSLQQGGTYMIKARWTENGRTIDQQRQVQVQPGQSATVDFRRNPAESVPSPKSPQE